MTYKDIWRTEVLQLPAVELRVALPPTTRVKYLGPVDSPSWGNEETFVDSLGFCEGRYNFLTGFFEFTLLRRPKLTQVLDTFVSGHEEGHLMYYLGELDQLRREITTQGYQFDFLSRDVCRESDRSARSVLDKMNTARDFERVWKNNPESKEAFANVAGLIALVKKGAPTALVQRLAYDIRSHQVSPSIFVESEVDRTIDDILSRTKWI